MGSAGIFTQARRSACSFGGDLLRRAPKKRQLPFITRQPERTVA